MITGNTSHVIYRPAKMITNRAEQACTGDHSCTLSVSLPPPPTKFGRLCVDRCLSVRLSVCLSARLSVHRISQKKLLTDLTKIMWNVDLAPRKKFLNFRSDINLAVCRGSMVFNVAR